MCITIRMIASTGIGNQIGGHTHPEDSVEVFHLRNETRDHMEMSRLPLTSKRV